MDTEDSFAAEIAPVIRGRRLTLGITQRHLATRARCSLSALRDIEGGFVPRRSQVVAALLAALDQAEASRQNDDGALAQAPRSPNLQPIVAADNVSG